MARRLLLSGDRADFTVLRLDTERESLSVEGSYEAPHNASWIEPVFSEGDVSGFVGLSEGDDEGLLYTFVIDDNERTCVITSNQQTSGAPAHFITLKDKSAIALATYLGGTAATYPISGSEKSGIMLRDAQRTELLLPFPYTSAGSGPDKVRQRQCHAHQILEDRQGLLYIPDLGSDRVWIVGREGFEMTVRGWLQCHPGTGPRHAVLNLDESIMYVLGELSHTVLAFDLSKSPAESIQPLGGFSPNIVPPKVPLRHQVMMDSSELCTHPSIPNILYATNRWERHIRRRTPHLNGEDIPVPEGDAISIILLSKDGRQVEGIKHIRTRLDVIRGMRLSSDGKYAAAVGQLGGGVEVYEINGARGDDWRLMAALRDGLDVGIKHVVWF